jgi:hypothetical protein
LPSVEGKKRSKTIKKVEKPPSVRLVSSINRGAYRGVEGSLGCPTVGAVRPVVGAVRPVVGGRQATVVGAVRPVVGEGSLGCPTVGAVRLPIESRYLRRTELK